VKGIARAEIVRAGAIAEKLQLASISKIAFCPNPVPDCHKGAVTDSYLFELKLIAGLMFTPVIN
jgi:hypothetical protein